jgi:gluconate 5-dehydrogenase
MSLFDLTNKTIIITGGYGHLGAAMAKALNDFNATVIIAGRDKTKFDELFHGKERYVFIECDITLSESIDRMIYQAQTITGRIDVLINNAQTTKGNSIEEMADEDWSHTIDGVLSSVHKGIRAVIPIMKKQGFGKIINIASMYGMVSPNFDVYKTIESYTNPPHYGAAKAAVIQLTKYYAAYLGKNNIQVNSISPGPFPNDAVKAGNELFIDRLKERTMLKRVGEAKDIGGAVIFLCSNSSDFITAHNLVVDGGWTAW